ncbi:MAG: hypothetical protein ACOYL3_16300 [Desulfuromonadaceae bacterium]
MKQAQFDQLLAWTMLGALYGAELIMQTQLGRELMPEERQKCHRDAHAAADLMRGMFADNRT